MVNNALVLKLKMTEYQDPRCWPWLSPETCNRYQLDRKHMRNLRRSTLAASSALALTALLLAGCAVGPDFKKPDAPQMMNYAADGTSYATTSAATDLGGAQRFLSGGDVPAAWWTLFQSAALNNLIETAVKSSPSLDSARAALRAAEENAAASTGAFFPSVDGSASDKRSKASGSDKPFTVYNTSVSVSYLPDVFGATRRTVESMDAKTEAQRFELEAAYLTLTTNVVTTAIQEAALRGQIAATHDIIAGQKKQLGLIKAQLNAGAVSKSSYLAQTAVVAASEATLPPLEKQLAATRNLMAVLLGKYPSEVIPASFDLTGFKLPDTLPVSLPSQLVEQRPDIRAAQANLQAANAGIGIATAAMLPQISLTGSFGVGATSLADMFSPTTAIWGLGAGLVQPLFHGGELVHKKRAAEALFDQSAAQYRGVVLSAFQNVADSLKALEMDALSLQTQLESERAAFQSLELTRNQYKAGAINTIDLLNAQTTYQQTKIALIKAKAARLSDTAALFQSLGGGWWQRNEKP